jgi:PIN domain nuclease of toxin-antitoxin system
VKILLDTSVLLNWLGNTSKITDGARSLVEAERNSIFFSPLSVWEARIKQAKGRLDLPPNFLDALLSKDFAEVRFTAAHAEEAGRLPAIHADPFDRGLIAQARVDGLTLLTNDRLLARYEVPILLA